MRNSLLVAVAAVLAQSVTDMNPDEILEALNARISAPYRKLQYTDNNTPENDVWWGLAQVDEVEEQKGNVRTVYALTVVDAGVGVNGADKAWNREHLWPQSRYGKHELLKTDLHHLKPSESSVNSARGNKPFGTCRPGCASHPLAPETGATPELFEPPNVQKGDIARAMFYMVARYREYNLQLVEKVVDVDEPGGKNQMGNLSELLKWHEQDPVNSDEFERNSMVCGIQMNRNPFVDFPCLVAEVFGGDGTKCVNGLKLGDYGPSTTDEPDSTTGPTDENGATVSPTNEENTKNEAGELDPVLVVGGIGSALGVVAIVTGLLLYRHHVKKSSIEVEEYHRYDAELGPRTGQALSI